MSYQEISEILDISLSQVKVNLFRARKQIRVKFIKSESYGL
ncbi:MAG: sigma factor-like helix-turn-helix DNA-binding protein [Pseudomonadota bacterium]